MYDALSIVLVGLCGVALWLGIRRARRLPSDHEGQSIFTKDLFPSLTRRIDIASDAVGEVLGGVLVWLLLWGVRLALFLGVLYGLVRFVKWAWER